MNPLLKRVLGESQEPLEVIEAERKEIYDVCPHCQQEIHEKHVYFQGESHEQAFHSDCKGPIVWPPKRVRLEHAKFKEQCKDPKHPWHGIFGTE